MQANIKPKESTFVYEEDGKLYDIKIEIVGALLIIRLKEKKLGSKAFIFSKDIDELSSISRQLGSFDRLEDFKLFMEMELKMRKAEINIDESQSTCEVDVTFMSAAGIVRVSTLEFDEDIEYVEEAPEPIGAVQMEEEEIGENPPMNNQIKELKDQMEEMRKDYEKQIKDLNEKYQREIDELWNKNREIASSIQFLVKENSRRFTEHQDSLVMGISREIVRGVNGEAQPDSIYKKCSIF